MKTYPRLAPSVIGSKKPLSPSHEFTFEQLNRKYFPAPTPLLPERISRSVTLRWTLQIAVRLSARLQLRHLCAAIFTPLFFHPGPELATSPDFSNRKSLPAETDAPSISRGKIFDEQARPTCAVRVCHGRGLNFPCPPDLIERGNITSGCGWDSRLILL